MVLGWIAPNHYGPWTSFHNEAPFFASVFLFLLGFVISADRLRLGVPAALVFAMLLVVVALQFAFGQIFFFGHALVSATFLSSLALAWLLGAHYATDGDARRFLDLGASVVVTAAAMSACLAIAQWLRMEDRLGIFIAERGGEIRPFANLAQPNHLATLMVMAIAAVGLLLANRRLHPWQATSLCVLLSFVLVATESRTGLLSVICVGAVLLLGRRYSSRKSTVQAVAVWWLIVFAFALTWKPLNEAMLLQAPRDVALAVDDVRMVIWRQVLGAIAQSPWWGYGWNQTSVAQKIGVQFAPGSWPTDYAHNVILDLAAWAGLPIAAALVAVAAHAGIRMVRRVKDTQELLILCAVIPFLIHSMLEFPFAYAYFLLPVGGILGALQGLQSPVTLRTITLTPVARSVGCLALVLGGLLGCKIFLEYLDAEEDMRVMRFELRRLGHTPADYVAPKLTMLTHLDQMLKMGRAKPRRGMSSEELALMGRTNQEISWATLHLNYVVALGINGNPEEAERQLQILRDLYGPATYKQAKAELNSIRLYLYPELSSIKIP